MDCLTAAASVERAVDLNGPVDLSAAFSGAAALSDSGTLRETLGESEATRDACQVNLRAARAESGRMDDRGISECGSRTHMSQRWSGSGAAVER